MIGKRCYSVECFNETVCEAVTAETTKNKPVIAYVASNAKAETQGINGPIYTTRRIIRTSSVYKYGH